MDQIFGAGIEFKGLVRFRKSSDGAFQFGGKCAAKDFFARAESGDEGAIGAPPQVS